ncbi:aldo-keto reductase [Acrodontium crateriforme]|uniref:Aldo-keto reductase n=1 Tax=Acrodontium crateriforme TaxID=150365 RepID=A0AAQ3MBX7_9PEZI|nr:aldo-keto reductase [Acrodontium crateriforme]
MATTHPLKMPTLMYGTAWKKDQTQNLVYQALKAGFRAIDTAAQPKHYQENQVGQGLRAFLNESRVRREELHIQTKFTSLNGQDPKNLPYDPNVGIAEQVNASVASSLQNLRHGEKREDAYIDCLILHSPFPIPSQTQEAWRAMESHVGPSVRSLGISNICHLSALQALYDWAQIKPSIVQNRFYAETGYDVEIRKFCAEKGVIYQSFWTLTANPDLLRSDFVVRLAEKVDVSSAVALYALVIGLGKISVLNGTTNTGRMGEDLAGVEKVRVWSEEQPELWSHYQREFRQSLGDLV